MIWTFFVYIANPPLEEGTVGKYFLVAIPKNSEEPAANIQLHNESPCVLLGPFHI